MRFRTRWIRDRVLGFLCRGIVHVARAILFVIPMLKRIFEIVACFVLLLVLIIVVKSFPVWWESGIFRVVVCGGAVGFVALLILLFWDENQLVRFCLRFFKK